jgi:cystathionine beta-lyase/cystathionine gamma-synthase
MEHSGPDLTFNTEAVSHVPLPKVKPLTLPIWASSTYLLESTAHGAALSMANGRQLTEENQDTSLVGGSAYLYSRWDNPTVHAAELLVNRLERGHTTYLFGSGMGAISATLFALLSKGDHCVVQTPIYGGTHEAFQMLEGFGIEVSRVLLRADGGISSFKEAIRPNTKLIYCESPANPICGLVDLQALSTLAKEKNLITMVDSTFASPVNQRPIEDFGFGVVVHSCTKYLGGHSDITAGAVICANAKIAEQVWQARKLFGSVLSPFEAFLLVRGIKTLTLRVQKQNENALYLAEWLQKHPKVERVYYPGLASHPAHELAKRQMKGGFGGMLSFEVKGGEEAGKKLVEAVKVINLAVSLGGVESLINHAASTTHIMVPRDIRLEGGITDGLIRFSVGIEDKEDLRKDLEQALEGL